MNIIRADQTIETPPLSLCIYGEPGAGKTSLAFSAEDPILLDFDHGAHRTPFRKDTALVDRWQDVATMSESEIHGYKTIVVDTVGRALDVLSAFIVRSDPKLARSSGELSLQGFGAMKTAFASWLARLRTMGKDIILLAHAKEEKQGDSAIVSRPDAIGSSREEIFKVVDAMAYLHLVGSARVLEFSPSDRWQAKDPASIGSILVGSLVDDPMFSRTMIERIKNSLADNARAGRVVINQVNALSEQIAEIRSADQANNFVSSMRQKGVERAIAVPVFHRLIEKSEESGSGFSYDKGSRIFVAREQAQTDAESCAPGAAGAAAAGDAREAGAAIDTCSQEDTGAVAKGVQDATDAPSAGDWHASF